MKNNKKLNQMFRIRKINEHTFVVKYPFWLIIKLFGRPFVVVLGYEFSEVKTHEEAVYIRNMERGKYVYVCRNKTII